MKETDSQMYKLTRGNRKLRKTLRSKSPHPSRRRKQASDSEGEEEEEDGSEGGSDESEERDDTEPMSSEGERPPPRRFKSNERRRSASRRSAKEVKPKGRSQRMMSVQRTDSEGGDSFEERGEIEEDFASSEKLLVEIDQEFKDLLEKNAWGVARQGRQAQRGTGWGGRLVR